ncbi:MAG: biopolymer transporter ExbD [Acidobacteria bacterium]|nr:biopolymer transporter ExbD [Acidobacteriota bacterium]
MPRREPSEGCEINMTPMIDVVFQLIIFFIVTIQMEKEFNPEIELEDSRHGPIVEGEQDPRTIEIEIDRRGWISIHNAQLSRARLREIMKARFDKYGSFPVLIRADRRTRHRDVRSVMDVCTETGIWRINFLAVYERRAEERTR